MSESDDILKDLRLGFYERFSNPVLFSFVISWLFLHYEVVLCVLSYDDYQRKLDFIRDYFSFDLSVFYQERRDFVGGYGNAWLSYFSGFYLRSWVESINSYSLSVIYAVVAPFLLALFYIFAIPLLTHGAVAHHVKKKQKLVDLKKEAEGLAILTKVEGARLQKSLEEKERGLEELQVKYNAKDKRVAELNRRVVDSEEKLKDSELFSLKNDETYILMTYGFCRNLVQKARPGYYNYDEFFNLHHTSISVKLREFCEKSFREKAELFEEVEIINNDVDVDIVIEKDGKLPPDDISLLHDLNRNKRVSEDYAQIAPDLGMSESRLRFAISRLEGLGLVSDYVETDHRRGGQFRFYKVTQAGRGYI